MQQRPLGPESRYSPCQTARSSLPRSTPSTGTSTSCSAVDSTDTASTLSTAAPAPAITAPLTASLDPSSSSGLVWRLFPQQPIERLAGAGPGFSHHEGSGCQVLQAEWTAAACPRAVGRGHDHEPVPCHTDRREPRVELRRLHETDVDLSVDDEILNLAGVSHPQCHVQVGIGCAELEQPAGHQVLRDRHARGDLKVGAHTAAHRYDGAYQLVDGLKHPATPVGDHQPLPGEV